MEKVEKELAAESKPIYPMNEIFGVPGQFRGTEEDVAHLGQLMHTDIFNKQYPFHTVYFIGTEVIGAVPGSKTDPRRKEALKKLYGYLEAQGLKIENCAVILTGSIRLPSAVDPVMDQIAYDNG